MANIHHDISGNPILSMVVSLISMSIAALASFTNYIPSSLQEFAYIVAIASGIFSIANVVVGWTKKKPK